MPGLSRLVNDLRVLEKAWEREVFVSTALGDFEDVLTVDSLQQLIEGGLPLAAARIFAEGRFQPPERLVRPRERRGRTARALVEGRRVLEAIREGGTLAVEELHLYLPGVARLCAAVHDETGYRVEPTAFLTPARATGFSPHRDDVSFFLRQVHGTKRWRVWAAEGGPQRERRPAAMIARQAPELDVLLKEGDCIYIPRGRVHLGETLDEPSVHLSLGIWTDTWAQALGRLIAERADGEESGGLADLLPPAFADIDREELLGARIGQVLAVLGQARWAALAPRPDPPAGAGLSLEAALDRLGTALRSAAADFYGRGSLLEVRADAHLWAGDAASAPNVAGYWVSQYCVREVPCSDAVK